MLARVAARPVVEPQPFEEPRELLGMLRRLAADDPARAREGAPDALASHAWQHWRDGLESAGLGLEDVERAFASARREIWLWLRGNRAWSQLSVQLTGRVVRRVESCAS